MAKNYKLNDEGLPVGEGLFRRNDSPFIWAKVYINGKPVRFSTKETIDYRKALKFRDEEVERRTPGDNAKGLDAVTIEDLMKNYFRHLEQKNAARGEYAPATAYIVEKVYNKHLKDIWGSKSAVKLGDAEIDSYRTQRLKAGAKVSSVDHELGYIRSAMLRGARSKPQLFNKHGLPDFKIVHANQTANPRTGTITFEQYERLMGVLPEWMRPIFAYCMWTGTRKKEATFVKRSKVDWSEAKITLIAHETKKGSEERITGVPDIAWTVIKLWEEQTRLKFPHCTFLFHYGGERIITAKLDAEFEKACRDLEYSTVRLGPDGEPMRRKNRTAIFDHAVHWHDSRRSFVTQAGNLPGVTDVDRGRTAGQTPQIQKLYDKNDSAKKVRDAINLKLGSQTIPASQPSALVVPNGDWLAELKELKSLFDAGLLPEDIYNAEVEKVMDARSGVVKLRLMKKSS